uniref:Uncharacterized protein n=1 Tax=Phlebotomus papatasi TaxID=29031 RepID=A0A1B0D0Y6_PHLPP
MEVPEVPLILSTFKKEEKLKEVLRNEKEYILDNCRACHDKIQEESQIFIFTTLKLPDIFKETTSLDIHENDELPKVLCCTCYNRLLEAYNFRKMCSATALHFQKILSMNIPEETYNPFENGRDVQLLDITQIKTDSDYLEDSCFSLGNLHCLSDKEDGPSGISEKLLIDERFPEVLKKESDDDDDAPLISRISQKAKCKQNKKKSILPGTRGNLICCICDSSFYQKSTLEMHMRQKHLGLKPCQCKICGKQFSRCGFKGHMEKYHGKKRRFPCRDCNSQYDSKWGLQLHMKKAHDPENPKLPANKVWACEICEKEFNKFLSLRRHRNTHEVATHSSGTRTEASNKYICSLCGLKNATTAANLRIHLMNIHMKEKLWSCEHCSYKTRHKISFKQHVKAVHEDVKDYQCPRCDRSFTRADNLKVHMLLHDGTKKFTCKVCGLKKVSIGQLNKHMNIHTREKLWFCDYCPYESPSKKTVKRHEQSIHEGVRNFHCPHCEKSFYRPETLRNHVMIHTGEKPHTCTECGKSYIKEISLKRHMKTHDPLYVRPHQTKQDRKYELWQRWWDAGFQ